MSAVTSGRDPADKVTPDLLPEYDLVGERPRKPTSKELAVARVKRFRETHGVKAVTINLPVDLAAALDEWIINKGKGRTKSQVIQKLIETQLLRVR